MLEGEKHISEESMVHLGFYVGASAHFVDGESKVHRVQGRTQRINNPPISS